MAQSPAHGILVLDDTGLPKQGRRSVGVARQDAGTLGKGAKCQVVVSAHAVADEPPSSAPIHWPLPARLSLPEGWAAASARRTKVRVPTDGVLQTKPALARALVEQARSWGVPFAPVSTDAGSGDTPTCLQGRDDRQGADVVGVSSTCGVRLPDEVRATALVPPPRSPRPRP